MDKIRMVSWFFHESRNGFSLNGVWHAVDAGQVRFDRYEDLTLPEALTIIEAGLIVCRPGDGWIDGCSQPRLF